MRFLFDLFSVLMYVLERGKVKPVRNASLLGGWCPGQDPWARTAAVCLRPGSRVCEAHAVKPALALLTLASDPKVFSLSLSASENVFKGSYLFQCS